ncbi:protein-disulfide reductase DsbD [Alteromonas sp. C1M14]|uniref:protein-disulfide reductase DsbD n=1 Tax=Alteromonas sp. C1M14 TaxID=2841567 RepID=UPI001C089223|nr:protein-disulfide reductase DsbD [Alteromonas sp. C1M14]MBU2978278.1 protein-disulfide reductase DsbD [Alteromonas sp. C1M14]
MKYIASLMLACFFILSAGVAFAQLPDISAGSFFDQGEPEYLPVEEAFKYDYQQDGSTLTLRFYIAEGYYLYKHQFKVVGKNLTVQAPAYPDGETKFDEFFGETQVYYQYVTFTVSLSDITQDSVLKVRFQGCADAGLCYPPAIREIPLTAVTSDNKADSHNTQTTQLSSATATKSQQFTLADRLASKENLALTLLLFLALGIGLAFTPCVFPMYPILSGIVLGQGQSLSLRKAFLLSMVYVQGMAITYSILGLVVASVGVQFQAALQHPVVLGIFILLFVALALAMFGAYEIQLPAAWQSRLSQLSNTQKRGNIIGVFVMGALSGLIASPCTTAPLTGILLFIAQSGDLFLGFISLYILSIGMGIPLIVFGMSGGKLLPKAGNWMNTVKISFGFMMLAVALIFIERIWVSPYTNLLWAGLGLAAFSYYHTINQPTQTSFFKAVRTLVIFLGLFGSAMLGYQTLSPTITSSPQVGRTASHLPAPLHPTFIKVKNLADFKAKLAAANAAGKTVMVDLYADWCVACKEFEKYTFNDEQVVNALSDTEWMQIDLTDNTPSNLEFQKAFDVLGLPTILFFNTQGEEITHARVTGFMTASDFATHVNQVLTH